MSAATIAVTDSSDSNKEKKVLKSKINKESALRYESLVCLFIWLSCPSYPIPVILCVMKTLDSIYLYFFSSAYTLRLECFWQYIHPPTYLLRLASLSTKMDTMDYEEDEDDVAAGEALTVPLADAFSGLQGTSPALQPLEAPWSADHAFPLYAFFVTAITTECLFNY